MTNTDTEDAIATAIQVKELALAGSEMVRITVNTPKAAAQVPYIREQLDRMGIHTPLIGDFHYNGHLLVRDYPECAKALSKYRINPGNVGKGNKRDAQFGQLIESALQWNKAIRIGVNWGSLDQDLMAQLMDENSKRSQPWTAKQVMVEALVCSAIDSAELAQSMGMPAHQIVLSCKVSGVQDLVTVYRELAKRGNYPLHLGLTEAGMGVKGIVASTAALALLLQAGIGDTIRISLAADPVEEVKVGYDILKSLHLRSRGINFIACPSCSRQNFDVVKTMNELEGRLEDLLVPLDVAVIGCVVNGPGEAKEAHVGLTGGTPNLIYIDGKPAQKLTNDNLVDELEKLIRQKAAEKAEADAALIARG